MLGCNLTNSLISERALLGIFVLPEPHEYGSAQLQPAVGSLMGPFGELDLRYEFRLDPVHFAGIYAVKQVAVGLAIREQRENLLYGALSKSGAGMANVN